MTGSRSAPTDARDAYLTLIRDVVSPAMRALGFKGSSGSYVLPDPAAWVVVGFQRSVHDRRDEVGFTVNLTVASKVAWEAVRTEHPYLPERPAPNTRYGPAIWQRRLGSLTPARADTWWRVAAETDVRRVGEDVVAALRDHALRPMLEEVERIAVEGHGRG